MAGYAIQARIDGVRPRLSVRASGDTDGVGLASWPGFDDDAGIHDPFAFTVAQEPAPTLAERWDQAGRVWSEMTFFLFDPHSWR
jgi:hypothetical protein